MEGDQGPHSQFSGKTRGRMRRAPVLQVDYVSTLAMLPHPWIPAFAGMTDGG